MLMRRYGILSEQLRYIHGVCNYIGYIGPSSVSICSETPSVA